MTAVTRGSFVSIMPRFLPTDQPAASRSRIEKSVSRPFGGWPEYGAPSRCRTLPDAGPGRHSVVPRKDGRRVWYVASAPARAVDHGRVESDGREPTDHSQCPGSNLNWRTIIELIGYFSVLRPSAECWIFSLAPTLSELRWMCSWILWR
jgi:hypothetical protein